MEDLMTRTRPKVEVPKHYNVVMLNDDFTPMDFVVIILIDIFKMTNEEAIAITFEVHRKGKGIAGTYPLQIAETKVAAAHDRAKEAGHPFRLEIQQA